MVNEWELVWNWVCEDEGMEIIKKGGEGKREVKRTKKVIKAADP